MGLLSFFKKRELPEPKHEPIDTVELDKSFDLLETVVADLSKAAVDASKVLQKKYGDAVRQQACFGALNEASDSVAFIDNDANIFFCNDQFVKTFGYLCYRQIINRPLSEIVPDFTKYNEMWDVVRDNHPWVKRCAKMKMKISVVPIMNGQPHPIYYICTFKSPKTINKGSTTRK